MVPAPQQQAPVLECFASVQGEGLYVGEAQVFLRLRGCPLRCRWCDTPGSWRVSAEPTARVASPGGGRREDAWASPFQAACWVGEVEGGPERTISVTGGEPLLWPDFILGLREMVGARRIHLETAGLPLGNLERVLEVVDHVSLDLKLAADLDEPEPVPAAESAAPLPRSEGEWAALRRSQLELLGERDACAKVIVAGGRGAADFVPILDDLAELAPELPLFLQPATPMGGVDAPTQELWEEVCERALDRDLRPRVVPQMHRLLGLP